MHGTSVHAEEKVILLCANPWKA